MITEHGDPSHNYENLQTLRDAVARFPSRFCDETRNLVGMGAAITKAGLVAAHSGADTLVEITHEVVPNSSADRVVSGVLSPYTRALEAGIEALGEVEEREHRRRNGTGES